RFQVRPGKVAADVTVMPLIQGTDYREFLDLTRGAEILPGAGDPHPESLLHFIMSINTKSRTVEQFANFAMGMAPTLKVNPVGWLGQSIAVYADADPVWDELPRDNEAHHFIEKQFHRFPVALQVEVKDALGVTAFLTSLRAFVEQTAPGMTV